MSASMSDKPDKPAEGKRRVKDTDMSDVPEKELTVSEEEKLQDEYEAEQQKQAPILTVAELKFTASLSDIPPSAKQDAQNRLLALIKEHKMAAYYKKCCADLKLPEDAKLAAELKEANDKGLKDLDAKIEDAKKNLGETEVRDALMARADYLALIGEKDLAIKAYEETLEKTVGSGGRIDVELAVLRLGLCWNDMDLLKNHLVKAKDFVERGGDWERKNLLAVYEATYLIMIREFKDAAKLLLDSVATFTCYRLFPYNSFIFYAVAAAVVSLNRISLRDKVVKNPDILSVVHEVPHLKPFVNALYDCEYGQFFKSLAEITDALKRDRYWSTHAGYFMRESRIVAYAQFLESYKSVTLSSMADAFGVTVSFLDKELSRFIAAGRLNAKIDKVGGIVETNRPDARNTQYAGLIKQGDVLLNRIQKLSKVINF